MTKLIYAYRIPPIHFAPYMVLKPHYAKVVYIIVDGKPKIEEVSFCENTLDILSGMPVMMKDIREKLIGLVNNGHVDQTILSAPVGHI
jgi:hypothetical protein